MKSYKKIMIFLLALFLIFITLEALSPKPTDWRPNFSKSSKKPYGSFLMYEILPHIFPGKPIKVLNSNFRNHINPGKAEKYNLIFINDVFEANETDAYALLNLAADGNHIFISANYFLGKIATELNIETNYYYDILSKDWINFIIEDEEENDSLSINMVNPKLKADTAWILKEEANKTYFESFDTSKTVVLGNNSRGHINFIKVNYGNGSFYLNTLPLAFTNYHLLNNNNHDYIFKALSYLPVQPVLWDEFFKRGRKVADSPLRFILQEQSLKWAYYLSLLSLLMFALFKAKRTQRIMPVIEPEKNTTLEFVETIGRIYYQNKDHKDIINKKILFLHDHLRTHYNINKIEFNDEFYRMLAAKAGAEYYLVRNIFNRIKELEHKEVTEHDLIIFNNELDKFFNR